MLAFFQKFYVIAIKYVVVIQLSKRTETHVVSILIIQSDSFSNTEYCN